MQIHPHIALFCGEERFYSELGCIYGCIQIAMSIPLLALLWVTFGLNCLIGLVCRPTKHELSRE